MPFQPKNCKLCNAPPVNHNRSPMAFLHILIVDDHAVVRKNVRSLVEKFSDWEVCAEAADGWEAIAEPRFDGHQHAESERLGRHSGDCAT